MDEKELIEERKRKAIKFLREKKGWIVYAALAVIVWINVRIRTLNLPGLKDVVTGEWTLGPDLDPFLFLRWAKYIVANGSLMVKDMMRSVPLGYNTSGELSMVAYGIAYLHKLLSFFSKVSVEYSAVIFPVVISVFTAIVFFLLVRKIFEMKGKKISNIIALVATSFMIVLPDLLTRTIAGIPEKESMGFFFIFLSFYLFLVAWRSKEIKRAFGFAILAGISTLICSLTWGGARYVYTVIALAFFVLFVLGKVNKKEGVVYGTWFLIFAMLPIFSTRFSYLMMISDIKTGISFAVFGLLIVDFILFKTKLKETMSKVRFPRRIISLIVTGLVGIIFLAIIMGPGTVYHFFGKAVSILITPYHDRLSFTVAENRQPYFASEWKDSFGPVFQGVPIAFWLFFVGSIFLFYELAKKIKRKERVVSCGIYIVFLICLIFSRYSRNHFLNGESAASRFVYFGGMILFFGYFAYVYYKYWKSGDLRLFKKMNANYILLIVLFLISLIAARSAVRLIMAFTPVTSIITAYFVVMITTKAIRSKGKGDMWKIIVWGVAIIVILSSVYLINYNYKRSVGGARAFIVDSYRAQWQKAMAWVRENTPKDSVFSHWWDYGYWVQYFGERATVLDGGNIIPYWNHLMGRHVLTGETEREAMEFMYTHNSDYLLIDSTDIGKYGAYSNIGSDEKYDRYSWIGTFQLNPEAIKETKEGMFYVWQGGAALDEDYLLNYEGKEIFLPKGVTGVGGLILETKKDIPVGAKAVFFYQNRQHNVNLRYAYYKGKLYDFGEGYEGAIYVMAKILDGQAMDQVGTALFLSERNMRALWVKMYLMNQVKDFELVYQQDDTIIEQLKNQGYKEDFVYYHGIRGPIKIWKAHFPIDIQKKPEYLEKYYPPELWRV